MFFSHGTHLGVSVEEVRVVVVPAAPRPAPRPTLAPLPPRHRRLQRGQILVRVGVPPLEHRI